MECPFGGRETFISSGADSADSSNLAFFCSRTGWERLSVYPKANQSQGSVTWLSAVLRTLGQEVRGVMFGFLLVENASYSGLACLICRPTCFFIRLQKGSEKDPAQAGVYPLFFPRGQP